MWSSTTVQRIGDRTYSLNVRLTSPTSRTRVPLTVPAPGNATTRPPGQWAIEPGPHVVPNDPADPAPRRSMTRSVPAADRTAIVEPAASTAADASTAGRSPGSNGI